MDWLSGAVSYPVLLTCQLVILLVLAKACLDLNSGSVFFIVSRRFPGNWLPGVGSVYLAVMVVRYVIRMALYPHERWIGGAIPILFHLILASCILVYGLYQLRISCHLPVPGKVVAGRFLSVGMSVVVGVCICLWVPHTLLPWALGRVHNLSPTRYAVHIERGSVLFTCGTRLVADIYHPLWTGKTPTILAPVPYTRVLEILI